MFGIAMQRRSLLQDHAPRVCVRSLAFLHTVSADSSILRRSSGRFASARNNPFRMTSFHNRRRNFRAHRRHGVIATHVTLLQSADNEKNLCAKAAGAKPFKMTTFANPDLQLLCNDIVRKKGGGWGRVAQFLGHSLNYENLSRGELTRKLKSPLACSAAG